MVWDGGECALIDRNNAVTTSQVIRFPCAILEGEHQGNPCCCVPRIFHLPDKSAFGIAGFLVIIGDHRGNLAAGKVDAS
jgi:hypothetical protein